MKKITKKTAIRNIVLAVGVLLLLVAVYLTFNTTGFQRAIQTILIALVGLGIILLRNHLFPRRFCNTCGKRLFLPWGDDHLWCALWYHPDLAVMGWYYHLRGEQAEEMTLQEQVRMGPSELRAKLTVIGRLLFIGPIMVVLITPFIFPIAWANWLTTISHISLICIVFLSNVIYMRDYNRKTGWDIILVSFLCILSPLCY